MTTISDLTRDYRPALLRFLSSQSETARITGYDIGRRAVEGGLSLLDLVRVHHEILVEVIEQSPAADHVQIAKGASDFLLEVVSTFDLAHRAGLPDQAAPSVLPLA